MAAEARRAEARSPRLDFGVVECCVTMGVSWSIFLRRIGGSFVGGRAVVRVFDRVKVGWEWRIRKTSKKLKRLTRLNAA